MVCVCLCVYCDLWMCIRCVFRQHFKFNKDDRSLDWLMIDSHKERKHCFRNVYCLVLLQVWDWWLIWVIVEEPNKALLFIIVSGVNHHSNNKIHQCDDIIIIEMGKYLYLMCSNGCLFLFMTCACLYVFTSF